MRKMTYTLEVARRDLFNLIKKVNKDHTLITIESSTDKDESAVLISKTDWLAIQETLYLETNGVDQVVRKREKDCSGCTNIDDIDWHRL